MPVREMLVGVDGCRGGWLAVVEAGGQVEAQVVPDWVTLMKCLPAGARVGVDIPIGLPKTGSRGCDLEARQQLGQPRGSSVFPTPVRGCMREGSHKEVSRLHRRIDGRGLTLQAYFLLPKIRQVDRYIAEKPSRQRRIREVHPEVSFAHWNGGQPMRHKKSSAAGQAERERLIDALWPGHRERLWASVRGKGCGRDDLNDAFAVLWTVRRIDAAKAIRMPEAVECDEYGVRMEIVA